MRIFRQKSSRLPLLIATIANLAVMSIFGGGPSEVGPAIAVIFSVGLVNLALAVVYGAVDAWLRLPAAAKFLCVILITYPVLQLLPLPPDLWTQLPGRETEITVVRLIGESGRWHPLSNAPLATAMFLVKLVPLGALYISVVVMSEGELEGILLFSAGIVILNVAIGAIQIASGGSLMNFYETAHRQYLLGFFPNRNHLALLLGMSVFLFGYLAKNFIRSPMTSLSVFALTAVVLFVAVLGSGSRTGMLLTAMAVVMVLATYVPALKLSRRRLLFGAGIGVTLLMMIVAIFSFSGVAGGTLARFDSVDSDRRPVIWGVSREVASAYFPTGAGIGTFVDVYKKHETLDSLAPAYVNAAHQDYLEAIIEGGLFAVGVIGSTLLVWLWFSFRALYIRAHDPEQRRARELALVGAGMILLPVLHSMVDYPLRRIAIASIFIFAFALLVRPFMRMPPQINSVDDSDGHRSLSS